MIKAVAVSEVGRESAVVTAQEEATAAVAANADQAATMYRDLL